MSAELLQYDMFSGQLVDNRTDYQKRVDKEREKPRQQSLFPTTEISQFQQNARPWLNNMPTPTLTLEIQDVRTDEERERELMKAAEALTEPMFGTASASMTAERPSDNLLIGHEPIAYRVPLIELGKEELVESRPDLQAQIEGLRDTDLEAIAIQAEEALRPMYMMVLRLTLTDYLMRDTTRS